VEAVGGGLQCYRTACAVCGAGSLHGELAGSQLLLLACAPCCDSAAAGPVGCLNPAVCDVARCAVCLACHFGRKGVSDSAVSVLGMG
jgi:hypothetical protein